MSFKTFDSLDTPTAADGGAELAAWLRDKLDVEPIWVDERTGSHHVFGYAESKVVLNDHAHFSSDWSAFTPADADVPEHVNLGTVDPPDHRRLRSLVNQAFPQRSLAAMEPRVREITRRLLDDIGDAGRFDLVERFSNPLPAIVVAELLGVPGEDQPLFRRWMDDALGNFDNPIGDLSDVKVAEVVVENLRRMREYLLEHIARRRVEPRDDLLTRLAQAEIDGDRFDDTEVYGMAAAILMGGQVSSTVTLGSALYTFDEHPEAAREVRADHSLIPSAVEEVLRFRPPVMLAYRLAKPGATLAGEPVPPGVAVIAWTMSANRDPRQFARPEVFDIRRTPNAHLTWGHGVHFCLGAQMGRMEARIALEELFDRYREIRCVEPRFHGTPGVLGIKSTLVDVVR